MVDQLLGAHRKRTTAIATIMDKIKEIEESDCEEFAEDMIAAKQDDYDDRISVSETNLLVSLFYSKYVLFIKLFIR